MDLLIQAVTLDPALQLGSLPVSLKSFANFLYCLFVVQMVTKQHDPTNWVHSIVSCVLAGYGGGILVPILLNGVPYPLSFEVSVVNMVLAWVFLNNRYWSQAVNVVLSSFPFNVGVSVGFEVFRTTVLVGWLEAARATVPAQSAVLMEGVPLLTPIICGTIGGCGGGLLPFDKGLRMLHSPTWPYYSALTSAVLYTITTLPEGHVAGFLAGIQLDKPVAKCCVAAFLVVCRLFPRLQIALTDGVFENATVRGVTGLPVVEHGKKDKQQ